MDQTSQSEKNYQLKKYNEIIDTLISAGYYRARINTLSEFDKVVGGLCWCIISSGEGVDVDILFQENLTIGQRIPLSEAIVKALKKMNCPALLQPHQIQGGVGNLSDFPAIQPVVTWLINKFLSRRDKREAQMRAFSTLQFSKNYKLPQDTFDVGIITDELSSILKKNQVVRSFKRKVEKDESEETRVRSCLLEFGEAISLQRKIDETNMLFGTENDPNTALDGKKTISKNSQKNEISSTKTNNNKSIKSAISSTAASSTAALSTAASSASTSSAVASSTAASSTASSTAQSSEKQSPTQHQQPSVVSITAKPISGNQLNSSSEQSSHPVGYRIAVAVSTNLTTLAEIGNENSRSHGDGDGDGKFERQLAQIAKQAENEEQLLAEQEKVEEAMLMGQMSKISDESNAVSGSQVGAILSIGSEEIGTAAAAYVIELEEQRKVLEDSVSTGRLGQAAAYKRQRAALMKQVEELSQSVSELQTSLAAETGRLAAAASERRSAEEYNRQLKGQIDRLKGLETAATQRDELVMLKNLISLNESLKAQEAAFKASCKAQLQDINARLAVAEQSSATELEEAAKMSEIEAMHAKMAAKQAHLRQVLAECNLESSNISRAIDDVPTRSELIQYERRFAELYQQTRWKLSETRKYYGLYNTYDTTLTFLQKEVKLLNSISDNLGEAMKTSASKAEYLQQIEQIVKGVDDSLSRQLNSCNNKEKGLDEIKATYQTLVDEQRGYFKAVKDFQEECTKNEWLTNKLQEAGGQ